jgi:tRNA U34 5-carboxymethylaminomethyl modifying GTPase MnmE/TrmE
MTPPARDTIFALSSGRGPSAIAVIRISGPHAGDALKSLTGKIPEARKAAFARVRDPSSKEIVDEALALWFPGPNSETGEDTAELQLHGGRAVIAAAFSALASLEGLRPAEAGEFTRRAFENGKLDLTAVEGLADLVGAETEAQRRQAFRQMSGALARQAEAWRGRLTQALALVEARIDFSDEADVPEDLVAPALVIARELEVEIAGALAEAKRGERLREGLVVAIAGPPNAGKSTLLNRIARREAAIVSPYAGTTRDVIEVHLDLDGWPVTLLDTAGIRDTEDPVELEGVRRAQARAAAADLVLWVVDAREAKGAERAWAGSEPVSDAGSVVCEGGAEANGAAAGSAGPSDRPAVPTFGGAVTITPRPSIRSAMPASNSAEAPSPDPSLRPPASSPGAVATISPDLPPGSPPPLPGTAASDSPNPAGSLAPPLSAAAAAIWRVNNKTDLLPGRNEPTSGVTVRNEAQLRSNNPLKSMVSNALTRKNESGFRVNESEFNISAASGTGVDGLIGSLADFAGRLLGGAEPALVSRERQRRALDDVLAALQRASTGPAAESEDLLAEELRLAARGLARLTGRIDVEDVLEVIFRDFCIGK